MSKNIAQIIYDLVTSDPCEVYILGKQCFKKSSNIEWNVFVKKIIEMEYNKCVKIIVKQSNDIGAYVDGKGHILGELNVVNCEGPFYIKDFNLTLDEYHQLLRDFSASKSNPNPSIYIDCEKIVDENKNIRCDCSLFKKETGYCKRNGYCRKWGGREKCDNCADYCKICKEKLHYKCNCDIHTPGYLCKTHHTIKNSIPLILDYYSDHDGLFKSELYTIIENSDTIKTAMFKESCVNIIGRYLKNRCKGNITLL